MAMAKRTLAVLLFTAFVVPACAEQACTPPANDYYGVLGVNGECRPIPYVRRYSDGREITRAKHSECTPDLKNRGTVEREITYAGQWGLFKCVIANRPSNDLRDEIEDLRALVDELKWQQNRWPQDH
jgi:hypothetical protein